jgi:hypothetical protein
MPLLDHLVGGGLQRKWNAHAERPGSLEVKYELIFRWLLKWQIARFFSPENTADIVGRSPPQIDAIGSVKY